MPADGDAETIIKKRKFLKFIYSEAGLPVFGQAVPAVNRPALGRLERDFALFATV